MKKLHNKLLTVLLVIILAACSTPAATPATSIPAAAVTPPISVTVLPAFVTFTDPLLEEMVRGTMGRPEGNIPVAEAEAVTRLNLSNELQQHLSEEPPVKDISGLENFTNLEFLDLSFHAITDLSPLAGLKKLSLLSLDGNPVADITPLAGLAPSA